MSAKKNKRLKIFSRSLFVIYLIVALYLMFFSEVMGRQIINDEYRYNLVIFKEIKRFLTYRGRLGLYSVFVNIAGNVIVFIPFGCYLAFSSKNLRSIILVTILTFCISLFIETIQLIFKVGSFDVDDLFLNTLGGFIGYLIYKILVSINGGYNEEKN